MFSGFGSDSIFDGVYQLRFAVLRVSPVLLVQLTSNIGDILVGYQAGDRLQQGKNNGKGVEDAVLQALYFGVLHLHHLFVAERKPRKGFKLKGKKYREDKGR